MRPVEAGTCGTLRRPAPRLARPGPCVGRHRQPQYVQMSVTANLSLRTVDQLAVSNSFAANSQRMSITAITARLTPPLGTATGVDVVFRRPLAYATSSVEIAR